MVRGNLLPEAVTWFFTSVLKALQVHGEHQVCNNTLTNLAMLIYDNLVRLTAGGASITASSVCDAICNALLDNCDFVNASPMQTESVILLDV